MTGPQKPRRARRRRNAPANEPDAGLEVAPPSRLDSPPQVTQAVRYLLSRHELSTGQALPQRIAVVSALGGEGVTTVSRALTEVLSSDADASVCWIDLNGATGRGARKPPILELKPRRAIEGTTGSPARLEPDSSWRVADEGGALPGEAGHGRAELDELLGKLAAEYQHIVLDMPPLLASGDGLGLLRHADSYILVTRQGANTLAQVSTVASELATIPSLGAVLNDYRTRTPRFVRRFFAE